MMLVAFPLPLMYVIAAAQTKTLRPAESVLDGNAIAAFVACLVVIVLMLLYVSSCIDWYVIRAWRDGIVIDPPCMRRGNRPTWLLITRVWLLHRIIATIGFFVGLWTLVGLAWFELAKHHGHSNWAIYLLGLVSPSAIPLFFMRSYISDLGHAVGLAFGNLPISIGDHVSWSDDGQKFEGIAYDVSIDRGYRVIERGGKTRHLSLADARESNIAIDEGDPPDGSCEDVMASALMGASDFWAPRTHASRRWLILS